MAATGAQRHLERLLRLLHRGTQVLGGAVAPATLRVTPLAGRQASLVRAQATGGRLESCVHHGLELGDATFLHALHRVGRVHPVLPSAVLRHQVETLLLQGPVVLRLRGERADELLDRQVRADHRAGRTHHLEQRVPPEHLDERGRRVAWGRLRVREHHPLPGRPARLPGLVCGAGVCRLVLLQLTLQDRLGEREPHLDIHRAVVQRQGVGHRGVRRERDAARVAIGLPGLHDVADLGVHRGHQVVLTLDPAQLRDHRVVAQLLVEHHELVRQVLGGPRGLGQHGSPLHGVVDRLELAEQVLPRDPDAQRVRIGQRVRRAHPIDAGTLGDRLAVHPGAQVHLQAQVLRVHRLERLELRLHQVVDPQPLIRQRLAAVVHDRARVVLGELVEQQSPSLRVVGLNRVVEHVHHAIHILRGDPAHPVVPVMEGLADVPQHRLGSLELRVPVRELRERLGRVGHRHLLVLPDHDVHARCVADQVDSGPDVREVLVREDLQGLESHLVAVVVATDRLQDRVADAHRVVRAGLRQHLVHLREHRLVGLDARLWITDEQQGHRALAGAHLFGCQRFPLARLAGPRILQDLVHSPDRACPAILVRLLAVSGQRIPDGGAQHTSLFVLIGRPLQQRRVSHHLAIRQLLLESGDHILEDVVHLLQAEQRHVR